jgi:hypothetical protein
MKTETSKLLEKTQIKRDVKKEASTLGCCGGAPVTNGEACCKLDEDKKAEGESECGCNATTTIKTRTNCC